MRSSPPTALSLPATRASATKRLGHPLATRSAMTSITHEALLRRNHPTALGIRTVVAETMTSSPHTIGRHEKLSRAHEVMREYGLRHLPVLDGGKLVGVLLQHDLHPIEAIAAFDTRTCAVGEAMATETYAVAPGELLADVARTMARHSYGCAVVVDRGHVVGTLTASDALPLHCHGDAMTTADSARLARKAIR